MEPEPSTPPPSITIWVTRDRVTVNHIRGLLEGLEGERALDYAEVRIIAVTPDSMAATPWGNFTYDTLPPQGMLFVSTDG